jgi:hypothetical protein
VRSDAKVTLEDRVNFGLVLAEFPEILRQLQDNGAPLRTVLMRIPREIYEGDQRVKARAIDQKEAGLSAGNIPEAGADAKYFDGGLETSARR